MVESMLPDNENVLSDRLKNEAEASRPEFSESLHARICEAVRSGEVSPRRRAATRSRRPPAYACVAAACLAVVSVVAWQLAGPRTPEPGGTALTVQTPEQLGELYALREPADHLAAADPLPSQDWAYLDHDARVVTRLLVDQLPLNTLASNGEP